MLIHATVTISGDAAIRSACEARLRRLLSPQFLRNEVAEHHGAEALCYDLKIEGGIPFPVFAQASQEFPGLAFTADWVNVAAGEKGSATIVSGRVTGQASERIATRAGDEHPVHVEIAPDGRLTLALTLIRAGREEWRGYMLNDTRDALLRLLRQPGSDAVELYATEGDAEWGFVWRGDAKSGAFSVEKLAPPVAIEDAVYLELERIVRQFVSDWIWFASERPEDIAVETARYERLGLPVAGANIRSSRLHRILADSAVEPPHAYSTLDAEERLVKDVILATWALLDKA